MACFSSAGTPASQIGPRLVFPAKPGLWWVNKTPRTASGAVVGQFGASRGLLGRLHGQNGRDFGNDRYSCCTSRTKQETDLSSLAGAPGVRVFATRGLRVRKEPDSAERLKKPFLKSKRRKKSYGRFKMGTQNRQWGERGHGPDRSQNHVILVHLPVVDQKESPTSRINPNSRCGPILTRIGAYEN